jgi:hypothetical protein
MGHPEICGERATRQSGGVFDAGSLPRAAP